MWQWLDEYWHQWVLRRQPKAISFVLNRRNLYTFPGASGFFYLGLTLILWLIGTNYQNNLILALAYWLISIFVVAILHAYANLAGVTLEILPSKSVFAEELAEFNVQMLATNKRGGENIQCQFRNQPSITAELNCQQAVIVKLPMQSLRRGWLEPGRLLVETYFPLGLIRCWTWLHFDQKILVYPKPIVAPLPSLAASGAGEMAGIVRLGGSDFDGLKNYQPGDLRKNIAWKAVAKGKGLFTKRYVDEISQEIWLDIALLNTSIEERLGVLAYWVLQLSEQNELFGLRLNALIIPCGQGDFHRQECLTALALFEGAVK